MTDDLTPLDGSKHWLGWLGEDPAKAVRAEIERILRQQVPTARLRWLRLLADPSYLTGGRKAADNPNHMIVTRAALAIPFELMVESAESAEQLRGVFSWVAVGLDGQRRRDRVHFDLGADMQWASDQLKLRIYELDEPVD
jgi:hypothetical protein